MDNIINFLKVNKIGHSIGTNEITITSTPNYVSMDDIIKYINSHTEHTVSHTKICNTIALK